MVDIRAKLGQELEYYCLHFSHHYGVKPKQLIEVMAILLGRIIAMHRADEEDRDVLDLTRAVRDDVFLGLMSGIQSIFEEEQGTTFEQMEAGEALH
jgi:hypothetical protein